MTNFVLSGIFAAARSIATTGFLKKLPALPITAGSGSLRRRIAITASAMTHNRQTMLAEGFDGYQTKPISLKDFLAEVQRVLAGGK